MSKRWFHQLSLDIVTGHMAPILVSKSNLLTFLYHTKLYENSADYECLRLSMHCI